VEKQNIFESFETPHEGNIMVLRTLEKDYSVTSCKVGGTSSKAARRLNPFPFKIFTQDMEKLA
jgi:hypothetical protein